MVPQASGQLRHIRIPEGEEHLALVAGYYIRLGIWHKRGIEVNRESLADSNSYDIFINKMGFVPQSNWLKSSNPKLRTASESNPHFYQFNSEMIQRIVLVGMWWRPEARDQRGYWDINPAQGGGCLLMDDRQAVFGGFPIHLSLLETPRKSWRGLISALNAKYHGCRLGYVPYKAYYPAEPSSRYIPAIVWPNLIDNIKLIQDICNGCEDVKRIFSDESSKLIDDWRWKSIELLWKRAVSWSNNLYCRQTWLSSNRSNVKIDLSNPLHGKRTPAAWVDLICSEWNSNQPLSINCININKIISKLEERPINLSAMTISRVIDRHLEGIRVKKEFFPRGSKCERVDLAIKAKEMRRDGAGIAVIAERLGVPMRRVYRLLNYLKNPKEERG